MPLLAGRAFALSDVRPVSKTLLHQENFHPSPAGDGTLVKRYLRMILA